MSKRLVCPIDINILPPRYRPGHRPGGMVFLLVLVLGLGLLPLYQARSQADAELGQLESRLKQLNSEMGETRQAAGGVKTLDDAIARATKSAETIEQDYKGVADRDHGFVAALGSCFEALPPGVHLLSASETGEQLTLQAEAESTDIAIDYASILKSQFPKVRLASLSKSDRESYPVAFTIVITR